MTAEENAAAQIKKLPDSMLKGERVSMPLENLRLMLVLAFARGERESSRQLSPGGAMNKDRLHEIKVTALPWDARKQMRAAVTIGDDVFVLTRDDQAMLRWCLEQVFDKGNDEAGG